MLGASLYFSFDIFHSDSTFSPVTKIKKTEFNEVAQPLTSPHQITIKNIEQKENVALAFSTHSNDDSQLKIKRALDFVKHKSRRPSNEAVKVPKNLKTSLIFSNENIKVWQNTMAIKTVDLQPDQNVLSQVGNLSIIEADQKGFDLLNFNKDTYQVVYDTRLNKAGIVTGQLKVTLNVGYTQNDLLNILKTQNCEVASAFPQINTYFVVSQKQVFNLEALYINLKNNQIIKTIEPEILSKTYEKN